MIYDIHQCRADERGALIEFLRTYWGANHILVHCDELFDFQHLADDGSYHFTIAINSITGEIDGVSGQILLSVYDPQLKKHSEGWGAIWKVRDDVTNDDIGMLGLLVFEESFSKLTSFGAIGISAIAKKYYKILKYNCGTFSHHYIANEKVTDFKIAVFGNNVPLGVKKESNATLKEVTISDLATINHPYHPVKSPTYILNRYVNHPIFKYKLLGVFDADKLCCALVTRQIDTQNSRCIRIVDIYGDVASMPNIYAPIQDYLQHQRAEYIDCLNYGVGNDVFAGLGFVELDLNGSDIVVPNYFEPFLRKNVAIDFAYKAPKNCNYVIFKGDADQDRPNQL